MQKAKKQSASPEELQLKKIGADKFNLAQSLEGGRDYLLDRINSSTPARDLEKLNAQNAVQLGAVDLVDSAGVKYNDTRLAARSGVVASAANEENVLSLRDALLNADLGNNSAVSASTRAAAESKMRLDNIKANVSMQNRADNINLVGSIVGAGLTASDVFGKDKSILKEKGVVDAGVDASGQRVFRKIDVDTLDPLSRDPLTFDKLNYPNGYQVYS